MEINRITCRTCCGCGYQAVWEMAEIETKDDITSGTLRLREVTCEACAGKGYIEYPVFTVEEAKAILKHCGLSTES